MSLLGAFPNVIGQPTWRGYNAFQAIQKLGLGTNLQLCLDAGDATSVPTSTPDKWLDLSGNGYDFYLGSGTGAQASDPTFNGTVGGMSSAEYWSVDGGDYFTYDGTNEAWMEDLHQDNALFTMAAWVYLVDTGGQLFGTNGGTGGAATGISYRPQVTFIVQNAGASVLNQSGTSGIATGGWNFLAMALTEATGAGGIRYINNGVADTDTSTYSSPAAGNASFTMQIGARGNANGPLTSGDRIAIFTMWSRALADAEIYAFYRATRGRFAK